TTPIKNQANSGTCWSFSGIGYVEAELLRQGKGSFDLSDMWIVRHAYFDKAVKYARMHGTIELAAGGACHDVFNVIDRYGIVPASEYTGLCYGTDKHIHGELDAAVRAYMDVIIDNPNRQLSSAWQVGLNGILDAYLGKCPEKFTYLGKEYTPQSFAKWLGIKGSDYVSVTSFSHHPFGQPFVIEVQDNWAWALSENLPLSDFMALIDKALSKGYPVIWAADVSERGFQYNKGFAVLPVDKLEAMNDSEKAKWSALNARELAKAVYEFKEPAIEQVVTQASRQDGFDNYQTTDDHGMVLCGVATDQNGNKFYKVRNSWGVDNVCGGYFYVSLPYVAAKTMNIMLPASLLK
ncbi:MAG: C1 family peptidase, partial [Mucinivorans sp.]